MPPGKVKGGNDIRTFFGGPSSGAPVNASMKSGTEPEGKKLSKFASSQTGKSSPSRLRQDDDDDNEQHKKARASSSGHKKGIKYETITIVSEEDEVPKYPGFYSRRVITEFVLRRSKGKATSATKKSSKAPLIVDSDVDDIAVNSKPRLKRKAVASSEDETDSEEEVKVKKKPRRSKKVEDDDFIVDDEEEEKRKAPKKTKAKEPQVKKKAQEAQATSSAPKAPEVKSKPSWAAAQAARSAGPAAPGSKEIPEGEEDCLAGLTFVFTGELTSLSREEAADLAKRFGGRVTGSPSSKTSYVIVGEGAGPKKLETIKKLGIKSLDEDGFLKLIATRKGSGQIDEKTKKKREKEEEAIRKAALEMEKRERAEERDRVKAASKGKGNAGARKTFDPNMQLWTTRYAPTNLKEICGNKAAVERLLLWLQEWDKSLKAGFKKPGKNAMNIYRAILITGPPGIGKTTSAHLCAKLAGFTPIELNASDVRSKKLVENGMNINNKNLDSWMGKVDGSDELSLTDRSCLIMDEVDGMSAGDRGGIGALNALIKKTKIPIICIANDRTAQKLKPLQNTTFSMRFSKPEATAVRSRMLSIAFKEKMKIPANVIDQLIAGSQSDIRQVLNMLSTWKLSNDSMSFDEGKQLVKANEKYTIMSPFDVTNKILGPYLFSATARETLGDKIELYFHDHAFVPLFIQENYLKTQPSRVRNDNGPEKDLKLLDLMDKAASSISDGDLVDALIHGPEQHWGLMPLHAVCSTIRPASHLYGAGSGYGGANGMTFPQWLGQNSKQNKLSRQLTDVQIRMRLRASGNKAEIRHSYIPALFPRLVQPLIDDGSSAVDAVIETLDEYYLSKEEWDTILELGVGDHNGDQIFKKIATATKTSLTRKYNSQDHPIAYHKGTDLGKAPKKLAGGPLPDLEDVFDFDEPVDDGSEDEKGKDEDELGGDTLVRPKKKAAAGSSKAKPKTKGKA